MKNFVVMALLCGLAACATTAETDTEVPPDRNLTTGSHIPRKGQAVAVDKQTLTDQINRNNIPGTSSK